MMLSVCRFVRVSETAVVLQLVNYFLVDHNISLIRYCYSSLQYICMMLFVR